MPGPALFTGLFTGTGALVLAASAPGQIVAAQPALRRPTSTVRIAAGALHGVAQGSTISYQGIPYAAPPTGQFRWRAPRAPAPWDGVRDATHPGPDCPQPINPSAQSPAGQSEDCLTLSLWTPSTRSAQLLPVLVWIHGGAFAMGGSASPAENGAALARHGMIVVLPNYRLGRLGWFAHPALTAEAAGGANANYGLMDQIAALHWVQANIARFGGDPRRITLAGESAGGWSTALLMAAPAGHGLFAQAIIESGFGRLPAASLVTAEAAGVAFARKHGTTELSALRRLPPSAFLGSASDRVSSDDRPGPIIDGTLLRQNVAPAFAVGEQARIPLLIGSNSFDASLLPDLLAHPDEKVFGAIPALLRGLVRRIYGGLPPHRLAAELLSDSLFAEPARFLSRRQQAVHTPVYRYRFDYIPAEERSHLPGAPHAAEVAYVFGNLPASATSADRKISATMMDYWASFVLRGDPNEPGRLTWPSGGEPMLDIGRIGPRIVARFNDDRLDTVERLDMLGRWMTPAFLAQAAAAGIGLLAASIVWCLSHRRRRRRAAQAS